jgi:hypothetical protein
VADEHRSKIGEDSVRPYDGHINEIISGFLASAHKQASDKSIRRNDNGYVVGSGGLATKQSRTVAVAKDVFPIRDYALAHCGYRATRHA